MPGTMHTSKRPNTRNMTLNNMPASIVRRLLARLRKRIKCCRIVISLRKFWLCSLTMISTSCWHRR